MKITSIIFTSITEEFQRSIKLPSISECFTPSNTFLIDNLMNIELQLREIGLTLLGENIFTTAILDLLLTLLLWVSQVVALDK